MGHCKSATKDSAMPLALTETFRAFVAERVDFNLPWTGWEVECLNCKHKWIAVGHSNPLYFECSRCEQMQGVRTVRRDDVIEDVSSGD